MFAVEGRRLLAAGVGFVEAIVFILAAGIVLSDLGDPIKILGFGAGYAAGTGLGVTLVRTLNLGTITVRIISPRGPIGVVDALRQAGFRPTVFDGEGDDGPVRLVLLNVPRKRVSAVMSVSRPWLDSCFVTVGEEPIDFRAFPRAAALRK